MEEYIEKIRGEGVGDLELFKRVEQPVYTSGNAYLNGAEGYQREKDAWTDSAFNPGVKIVEEGDEVFLEMNAEKEMFDLSTKTVSTETLGTARIVDAIFDDPDGNPITMDTDYRGAHRTEKPVAGPIEGLKPGFNRVKVWG